MSGKSFVGICMALADLYLNDYAGRLLYGNYFDVFGFDLLLLLLLFLLASYDGFSYS